MRAGWRGSTRTRCSCFLRAMFEPRRKPPRPLTAGRPRREGKGGHWRPNRARERRVRRLGPLGCAFCLVIAAAVMAGPAAVAAADCPGAAYGASRSELGSAGGAPGFFKICKDQTYALCPVASCLVFKGIAYCKCEIESGDSISLPFRFGKGQDVCTVNAQGAANGYMVSTLSLAEEVTAPTGDMAIYTCPARRSDGAYAQCDGASASRAPRAGRSRASTSPCRRTRSSAPARSPWPTRGRRGQASRSRGLTPDKGSSSRTARACRPTRKRARRSTSAPPPGRRGS